MKRVARRKHRDPLAAFRDRERMSSPEYLRRKAELDGQTYSPAPVQRSVDVTPPSDLEVKRESDRLVIASQEREIRELRARLEAFEKDATAKIEEMSSDVDDVYRAARVIQKSVGPLMPGETHGTKIRQSRDGWGRLAQIVYWAPNYTCVRTVHHALAPSKEILGYDEQYFPPDAKVPPFRDPSVVYRDLQTRVFGAPSNPMSQLAKERRAVEDSPTYLTADELRSL